MVKKIIHSILADFQDVAPDLRCCSNCVLWVPEKGLCPWQGRQGCLYFYALFLLLTNKRTTKNAITITITVAARIKIVPGFTPLKGEVVVVLGVGVTWLAGELLGVGRITAGLEGGMPSGLKPA